MNKEKNKFEQFIRTGMLYKSYIPLNETDTFEPNTEYDIYFLTESESIEYLISQEDFPPQFSMKNVIYEIPVDIQKKIDGANRQRQRIQQWLREGNLDKIKDIRLIIMEIKIDGDDLCRVAEKLQAGQGDNKHIGLSLKNVRFTLTVREKCVKDIASIKIDSEM